MKSPPAKVRGWPSTAVLGGLTLSLTVLCLGDARPALAQDVRFPSPRQDRPAQRELARFIDQEQYAVWMRDTILARGDTVPVNVLVLEAAVRIAGRVEGSVYVAGGDLFLRPGAEILGDVLVVGGGYYASTLAEVDGSVTYRPVDPLRAVPEDGVWIVFSPEEERPPLDLGPLYGLRFPTYQRVDGWTLGWGAAIRPPGLPWRPELHGEVRFRTEQERLEGTGRVVLSPGRRSRLRAEVIRQTRTNEEWIWPTAVNTLSYLLLGNDYRDYYRADAASLDLELRPGSGWTFLLGPRWQDASSLPAFERTVLLRSDRGRLNPAIDEGETASFLTRVQFRQREGTSRTLFRLELEGASEDLAGDFSFLRGELRAGIRRTLPVGHAVETFMLVRGDLAGSLPRQEWTGVGGIGTLPTFPILALRGPRIFLTELAYVVPIPRLEVPHVGPTEVLLRGVVGSAWAEDESPRVEQNVVAGIRFFFLEGGLAWDPGEAERDFLFYLTGRFPRH